MYLINLSESSKSNDWPEDFYPSFSPKEMLEMGVFEGKYLNKIRKEFPANWFSKAKLAKGTADEKLNMYGVKSRKSISHWKDNGWINNQDPLGWFQWYCRFYLGRRSADDSRQIKRWRSFIARHQAQVIKGCSISSGVECRPRQKQGLLQWAWDWKQNPNSDSVKNKNIEKLNKGQ
jgi:hypothetical protein